VKPETKKARNIQQTEREAAVSIQTTKFDESQPAQMAAACDGANKKKKKQGQAGRQAGDDDERREE
jgi:hypothetical protein